MESVFPANSQGGRPNTTNFLAKINGNRKRSAALEQTIRTTNPDILHSHFGFNGLMDYKLARKHGLKHIVSFYGGESPNRNIIRKLRYNVMFPCLDMVLCEGPFYASQVVRLGCKKGKVKLQRLGVSTDKISYQPRTFNYGDVLKILICSNFTEKKGIPYAIEALGRLRAEYDKLHVTIIGDAANANNSGEKEKILSAITHHLRPDQVTLLGYISHDEMIQKAYGHHIFLSPSVLASDGSTEGGAPVTIIEMAASGMPIVSTNHCDIPYVLGERNRSILCPERDAKCLKETMLALIKNGWDDVVESNVEYVRTHLDIAQTSQQLLHHYLDVMS